jgi:ribosomal protein S27AE
VFFSFFFGIFLFSDSISDSPFGFILSFFAMFLIMALIIIVGTFFLQKSTQKNLQRMNGSYTSDEQFDSVDNYDFNPKKLKENMRELENNFCPKCGSRTFHDDRFCLNCGIKIY